MSPKDERRLAWATVALQIALLVAVLVVVPGHVIWAPSHAWSVALWIGRDLSLVCLILALTHLGDALTPLPTPRANGSLRTNGFYRLVRHPAYSTILLFAILRTLDRLTVVHAILLAALVVLFEAKARWEERLLLRRFSEYRDYGNRTGRFVPGIGRLRTESGS